MATESTFYKPHTLRRVLVHFFAACYGLFVAAFVGAFSYAHLTDYHGNLFVGLLGVIGTPAAGILIWRQTVNLNRAVEAGEVSTQYLSLRRLFAYVTVYAVLFCLIGGVQQRFISMLAAGIAGALTGRFLSELAPTTTPIRWLVSVLLAWLLAAIESVSHHTQPSLPPLMHSGHLIGLVFGLLVTCMTEVPFYVSDRLAAESQ
jgi:hypothetical protein